MTPTHTTYFGPLYKNKQTTQFALLITVNKYNKFNRAVYA